MEFITGFGLWLTIPTKGPPNVANNIKESDAGLLLCSQCKVMLARNLRNDSMAIRNVHHDRTCFFSHVL